MSAAAANTPQTDLTKASTSLHFLSTELGFDAVGVAPPTLEEGELKRHYKWLARGYFGDMLYLARKPAQRYDARTILPSCRSVIVVALAYNTQDNSSSSSVGKVSRYALGDDYHQVLLVKLRALRDRLRRTNKTARFKLCVDTSPLNEKAFAIRAGIGWAGRNSLVLDKRLGSYFFLGLLLTDLELPYSTPQLPDCGTCNLCVKACPTGALSGPGILDANKCVSYQTTERRSDFGAETPLNGWLYGCDTCQEVCPYNDRAAVTSEPRFSAREPSRTLDADGILAMDDELFERQFAGTVLYRRGLGKLQSQARIVLTQNTSS